MRNCNRYLPNAAQALWVVVISEVINMEKKLIYHSDDCDDDKNVYDDDDCIGE